MTLNYTHSFATVGWLWIQEYGKNQQKHSKGINQLYVIYDINEFVIFISKFCEIYVLYQ